MNQLFSLNDFDLENKIIGVRMDLNLPYNQKTGRLSENLRLYKHIETIRKLEKRKAKIVILAHQGRKGKPDFISLEKHAKLLEKHLKKKVKFLPYGKSFSVIKKLKNREILLLDNVRFYIDETKNKNITEHAKSTLPKKLSVFIDYFVLDAFSVSHRCHASVVGFSNLKPCIAGPVFELEIKKLNEFLERLKKSDNRTFILGGAKPEEPLNLIEKFLKKDIKVLTTGIISLLFLTAKGYKLGKTEEFLKEKGYLNNLQRIKKMQSNKIKIPVDLAIEKNGKRVEISLDKLPVKTRILDIGKKTIENYKKIILCSDIVCMKGPAGVYENKNFELGTKKLFDMLRKHNNSLLGGGNTIDALEKFKIPLNRFGYVSLGGGAFVEFITEKESPGIKALNLSFSKFKNGA